VGDKTGLTEFAKALRENTGGDRVAVLLKFPKGWLTVSQFPEDT
jgi:hypothetical protein